MEILDFIFSSFKVVIAIIIGSMIIFVVVVWKVEKSESLKKKQSYILRGVFTAILAAELLTVSLNAYFWGFGRSNGLSEAYIEGTLLAGMDNRIYGSGYEEESKLAMLYVVDLENGKRLLRKKICSGTAEIAGIRGDSVLAYHTKKESWLVNARRADIVYHLNEKTLPEVLPEFAGGVFEFRLLEGWWEKTSLLEITARDGRIYYVDLFSRAVVGREKMINRTPYILGGRLVRCEKDIRDRDLPFYLTGGIRRTIIGGGATGGKEVFIRGLIMQFDRKGQKVYILSYETADRVGERLTCLNRNGSINWRIDVDSIFSAEDLDPKFPIYSALYRGGLLFVHGGNMAMINTGNGSVRWKIRL